MDQHELSYWLAFWRMSGIGPGAFRQVIAQLGAIGPLFEQSASQLEHWGFNARQRQQIMAFRQGREKALLAGVQQDLDWQSREPHHHILTWQDTRYPPLLREIAAAPPVLFVRGDLECLCLPQIAIVGSRHCSRMGKQLALEFARHFSRSGFVTTSGLALGIDSAAHEGALEGGNQTIAVLAHGLDTIFPTRNRGLGERVREQGALVSEFPIGVQPRPEFFPRRNRIISGLSLGVLVVEAALKSGSLITANEAVDQGREVFAIPGSIHSPLAKGCHALIRNGAKLVETADQVVEELMPLLGFIHQHSLLEETVTAEDAGFEPGSPEQQLFTVLEYEPSSIDQLVQMTGLSAADVSSALVLLELEGVVQQQRGGYCRV